MKTLTTVLLLSLMCLPAAAAPSIEALRTGLGSPAFAADLGLMRALAAKGPKLAGAEVPPAPPAELSCEEEPGAKLCRKADYLSDLFGYECTGSACVALWRLQTRGLKELYDLHGETVKPQQKARKEMGEKVKSLAGDICRMEFTGTQPEMFELTITINVTMPKLKDLQERAGIEKPRHCKFQ